MALDVPEPVLPPPRHPHTLHLDFFALGVAVCGATDDPLYVVARGDASAVTCHKCRSWKAEDTAPRQTSAAEVVDRLLPPRQTSAGKAGKIIRFPGPAERRKRRKP